MKDGPNQGNIPPVSRRRLLASAASMALVGCASMPLGRPNAAVAQSTAASADRTYVNSLGMEFTLIRAGSFMMGSPDHHREAREFERPQHQVTISKPFYLGRYEVTQERWEAVMGSNPYTLDRSNPFYSLPGMAERITRPNHPATVSWIDAQHFIALLNEREGGNRYRLPTEAEWEYAACAGTTMAYSFGDDNADLGRHAWYGEDFNSGGTHPVGQKEPNPWGLYDIHGNAWEWVRDWFDPNYYASSPPVDPQGPQRGTERVVRGGSWHTTATNLAEVRPLPFRSGSRA